MQFTLIHGPNTPVSSAILFFITSDFTFTTRHIHKWASFPLWPSCFILSLRNCPLFFPSSILDTFRSGVLIFWCHIFLPLYTVHGVLITGTLEWFASPSSSGLHLFRTLHYDPSILGGPAQQGSQLHWVMRAPSPWWSMVITRQWSVRSFQYWYIKLLPLKGVTLSTPTRHSPVDRYHLQL